LSGHTHWITKIFILSNGYIASGSWDKTIKIFSHSYFYYSGQNPYPFLTANQGIFINLSSFYG
jgi:hypothetical protein